MGSEMCIRDRVETDCRWRMSVDGHGSVGYFQLTPKFLDRYLRPLFPDYDKPYSKQHIEAAIYYIGMLWRSNPEWLKKSFGLLISVIMEETG